MQSKAKTVAVYLKEVPEERRKVMTALTTLCKKTLVGFDEGMEYGMPYYKKGGLTVGVASQKNYISVYGLRKQAAELGAKLEGAKVVISAPVAVLYAASRKRLTPLAVVKSPPT